MRIESPDPTYVVEEFEFQFTSDHYIELTVDPRYDTVEFTPTEIIFKFGPKNKAGRDVSGETLTVYRPHLISSATRSVVKVSSPGPEDENEWFKNLKEASKLKH